MIQAISEAPYTLIFGLGQTGESCVRYAFSKGMRLRVIDTRLMPPNLSDVQKAYPNIELFLGPIAESNFDVLLDKVDQIIVSPGIDVREQAILQLAKARKIPIIGDIELFARDSTLSYIAITGSNGKTTVTTLVGELLAGIGIRAGVGGNIGKPALDLLLEQKEYQAYVLELSSFQLETADSLAPMVATILNITPDHLDRYDSYDDYVLAKQKILKNANCIIPEPSLGYPKAGEFGIASHEHQDWLVYNNPLDVRELDFLCPLSDLKLIGTHNYLNIISALSLVQAFGLSQGLTWSSMKAPLIRVLKTFEGLEHRCQWIACHEDITWINDSKGTNIGASLAALHSMLATLKPSAKLILIAGGEGKSQDFELLRQGMEPVQASIREVILIGKDAPLIQQALIKSIESICVETLSQAIQLASKKAYRGDTILLSPSCSSLDQYANYAERGQDFIQTVTALTGNR